MAGLECWFFLSCSGSRISVSAWRVGVMCCCCPTRDWTRFGTAIASLRCPGSGFCGRNWFGCCFGWFRGWAAEKRWGWSWGKNCWGFGDLSWRMRCCRGKGWTVHIVRCACSFCARTAGGCRWRSAGSLLALPLSFCFSFIINFWIFLFLSFTFYFVLRTSINVSIS